MKDDIREDSNNLSKIHGGIKNNVEKMSELIEKVRGANSSSSSTPFSDSLKSTEQPNEEEKPPVASSNAFSNAIQAGREAYEKEKRRVASLATSLIKEEELRASLIKEEELRAIQFEEERLTIRLEFQRKKQSFQQSLEYNYVQQFAKKYKNNPDSNDISKLRTLLQKKQWMFSTEETKILLLEEEQKQQLEIIKSRILATNPITFENYLQSFIEIYGNDKEKMNVLRELLISQGINSELNTQQLEQELKKVIDAIELEIFERRLLDDEKQITIDEIDSFGGYEFEEFLKNLFSKMGYQVQQTKLSGDQGADLVVVKFGEKKVIQAKRYGGKVGNKAVQEIMAAISFYKAHRGMVVTSNYFTLAAIQLAKANAIELIDRDELKKLIENH